MITVLTTHVNKSCQNNLFFGEKKRSNSLNLNISEIQQYFRRILNPPVSFKVYLVF